MSMLIPACTFYSDVGDGRSSDKLTLAADASAYFHALNSRKELRLVLEGSESGGTGNAASFFTKSNVPGVSFPPAFHVTSSDTSNVFEGSLGTRSRAN